MTYTITEDDDAINIRAIIRSQKELVALIEILQKRHDAWPLPEQNQTKEK